MKNVHFNINYSYGYLVHLLTCQVWKDIKPICLSWRKKVVEVEYLQNHLKGDDTESHRVGSEVRDSKSLTYVQKTTHI